MHANLPLGVAALNLADHHGGNTGSSTTCASQHACTGLGRPQNAIARVNQVVGHSLLKIN